MEVYEESIWKLFLGEKAVVKELNAIRPKGIIMEVVLYWFRETCGWMELTYRYEHPDSMSAGYAENYYEAVLNVSKEIGRIHIRIAWAYARMGIPTLSIGVDCKEHWIAIRDLLRKAGLAR